MTRHEYCGGWSDDALATWLDFKRTARERVQRELAKLDEMREPVQRELAKLDETILFILEEQALRGLGTE